MEYRALGKSGLKISEVSLGCWVTGGSYWGGADDGESVAAIRKAVEMGVNFIDTAELYGWGRSEEIVGKALKGLRDRVCLSSKVWKENLRREDVKKALEGSLKKLQADWIDVYFIHYPSETGVPIEETMGALEDLKKEGKIRAVGVSNFSVEQVGEAMKFGRVDVVQPCYSLLWRYIEEDLLPFCIQNEIGVVIYSPLAQGLLTGKFKAGTAFREGDGRAKAPLFKPGRFEECIGAAEALKPFAEKYGKTQGQIAVNWAISQPGVTSAIVGARNAAQAEENTGAGGWRLKPEDILLIDRIGRKATDKLPKFVSFFKDIEE